MLLLHMYEQCLHRLLLCTIVHCVSFNLSGWLSVYTIGPALHIPGSSPSEVIVSLKISIQCRIYYTQAVGVFCMVIE